METELSLALNKKRDFNFTIVSINDYLAFGPRYIHALLRSSGLEANLVFFRNLMTNKKVMGGDKQDDDLLLSLLSELKTSLVGISVCSPYLKIATDITRRIRKELKIPILWGGVHPTVMPEESLQAADMICIGEGELSTLELIERFSHGRDVSDIEGIWTKRNKNIMKTPLRSLTQNLDGLPFPEYSDSAKYFIESGHIYVGDPASYSGGKYDKVGSWRKGYISFKNEYYTFASRGCPYNCTYCCNSIAYSGRYRMRSVAQVIEEICLTKRIFPNIKRIQFYDAIFPWDKNWVNDFCLEYKKKVNLPFYIVSHFDMVTETNVDMMKWAGLDSICFGIESGSERIRREVYNKRISNDSILEVANLLHEKKVFPYYCFIVDNPFEKEKEKQEALSLLLKLPKPFIITMHALYLFPRARITEEIFLKFGKLAGLDKEGFLEKQTSGVADFINKPIEDIFWQSILSLSAKSFFPRPVIKLLFNCKMLRYYPNFLYLFAKSLNYMKFIAIGMLKLMRGEITIKNIRNNVSLEQFINWYN